MPSFLATARSNQLPSKNIGNVTVETQYLGADGNLLTCPLEGSIALNNRRFRLLIAGTCGSGAANTVRIRVYSGVSTTIASNTLIADTSTVAMASANHNFFLESNMMFDTTSSKVQGTFSGMVANAVVALAAQSNVLTSFSDVAEGQGFTITAIFSGSNAAQQSTIYQFELVPE